MTYYNIHTHRQEVEPNTISIANLIVKNDYIQDRDGWQSAFSSGVFFSAGIHPWYLETVESQLSFLRETLLLPQVIAVGEAGLDKLTATPLSLQQYVFWAQAQLAEELNKPLIIHCVKAWDELVAAKKKITPRMPWIIHGFRGNWLLATQLIQHGFYLSFSNYFNPATLRREILLHAFLETDEQQTSIQQVYQAASSHLNMPIEILAEQLSDNFHRVFSF